MVNEEKQRVKQAMEQIEPASGAEGRMLEHIRAKAAAAGVTALQEKKRRSGFAAAIPWALPLAACAAIAVIGIWVLKPLQRTVPKDTDAASPESTAISARDSESPVSALSPVLEASGPDASAQIGTSPAPMETVGIEPESPVLIVNPLMPVENAEAFSSLLDLQLDAPEGAEEVQYTVISNQIAQIDFLLDGRSYTLRAARSQEDFSGLYGTETVLEQREGRVLSEIADGDAVWYRLLWDEGGVRRILTNTDGADEAAFRAAAKRCGAPEN